ncbi:MAG: ATP-binding cassette domain-containing protein [Streptosporangiales bacterium]|nr:ATP-binding cassette domain-containing protein [Streptosporangiales bacterium]
MPGIVLRSLSKVFPGGIRAVDELDLAISDGEFFALLGPSGCGKTTLLRMIAGLEPATGGTIHIGERDVTALPPGRRDVAMVFQDYALFPNMTVADNVAYPLRIKKVPKAERYAAAAETGESLGLGELMERRPGQLSGGQQQRVAVARAIAARPTVFLFDEPLSNLDARLRLEARTFLKRLQRELGVTTVFVTHDQAEAIALADRMAVMERGRIRQLGRPREVFLRPANTFVANFIGSTPMNLLHGRFDGSAAEVVGFRVPVPSSAAARLRAGEEVIFGIRPEYLHWSTAPAADAIRGRVAVVEGLGVSALVTLEAGGADGTASAAGPIAVRVTVPEGREFEIGSELWVTPPPDRSLIYRADDGELVGDTTPARRP